MQTCYSDDIGFPKGFHRSIFLAGPTPRCSDVKSWRPQALELLKEQGYEGVVFIPEHRDGCSQLNYDGQVEWESAALALSDVILFWVPRQLTDMPGFTTNHEHGEWFKSGRTVLGAPKDAPKMRYLRHRAGEHFEPHAETLERTIELALHKLGHKQDSDYRTYAERNVPLELWRSKSFQPWYQQLKESENRLDKFNLEWVHRVGPTKNFLFAWAAHVDIHVQAEARNKSNEFVISRPDIATTVLYCKGKSVAETDVVLIEEFRSPVRNKQGMVLEIPGGSSFKGYENYQTLAAEELKEETGLDIAPYRIRAHSARQLLSTFSGHVAHVFSAELTRDEMSHVHSLDGQKRGVAEDTEITYLRSGRVGVMSSYSNALDWSNIGMILSVVTQAFREEN